MNDITRPSGRAFDKLREISFESGPIHHHPSSVLVRYGRTHIICTATIDNKIPSFLKGSGKGWLTAEYGMLPCSTHSRMARESARGKQTGRTKEIQRLIGRSLRACMDFSALGERTITIDCDVVQADGGTRTAAISGSYVALCKAIAEIRGELKKDPLHGNVASVSTGIYQGSAVLDLDYEEDRNAETDMNIVMNEAGRYIEIQGTAEGHAFHAGELQEMLSLAEKGINEIIALQKSSLKS